MIAGVVLVVSILANHSFETAGGWTFGGLAEWSREGIAHRGRGSALLKLRDVTESDVSQSLGALDIGETYDAWLWFTRTATAGLFRFAIVEIDPGTGVFAPVAAFSNSTVSVGPPESSVWISGAPVVGSWWLAAGVFTVQGGGPVRVRVRTEKLFGGVDADWYIDDVWVRPHVITTTIKNALVQDLQSIDGNAPFVSVVAEVGAEPKRIDEAKTPGVYINSSDGESDLATVTNRKGEVTQTYTLDLVISSSTPNADMDALLDDVRNACERTTSALLGVAGVQKVTVTGWTPVETDPGISMGIYFRQVDVSVTYYYSRGSA